MNNDLQIIEKPDWVSWDDIHEILWEAHAENRAKGVYMRYPSLPGNEIRQRIEGKGKMFVAVEKEKLIGTAALVFKDKSLWCGKGTYGYCCFASVLPSKQGGGVYKALCDHREQLARNAGVDRMLMDTNENNKLECSIVKKAGYKPVGMSFWNDHYNIVFVKWLDGCPFSDFRCYMEFTRNKVVVKTKQFVRSLIKKRS